jgi:hypothetical protein
MLHRSLLPLASLALLLTAAPCFAQDPTPGEPRRELRLQPLADQVSQPPPASDSPSADRRDELPHLGLTESPYGLSQGAFFAGLSGTAVSARAANEAEGGVRVGFSPLSRLTLHGFAGRDAQGRFSPVLTGHFRLLGSLEEGFALGAVGQYKAEGFSDLGGEMEVGLTAGFRRGRFSLMGNVVTGFGLDEGESGEVDGEGKLRMGFDMAGGFRLGAEGQARRRFSGTQLRPNGKNWDVQGGPQLLWASGPMVVAFSFGPTNVSVADGTGTFAMLSVTALAY